MSVIGMPKPGYEFKPFQHSSHDVVLNTLAREERPLCILDVGTASGYLGKVLRERGHYLVGIEGDPVVAEGARPYYDALHVANIETFNFSYLAGFDYVIFADVLEHLRDPAAVVRAATAALRPGGKIIVSVPNIANIVVRLSLLFGRFDYQDRGILDRTHLRFFTVRTLREMMDALACRIVDVTPTPLPVQLVLPSTNTKLLRPLHELHFLLTRCWKSALAYQIVITAEPSCVPTEAVNQEEETVEETVLAAR